MPIVKCLLQKPKMDHSHLFLPNCTLNAVLVLAFTFYPPNIVRMGVHDNGKAQAKLAGYVGMLNKSVGQIYMLSRELTFHTSRKGNSSSRVPLVRDMLGPQGVPTLPLTDLEMHSACLCFSQHLAFAVG